MIQKFNFYFGIFRSVWNANWRYFLSHRGAVFFDAIGSVLWSMFGILSVIFTTARVKSVGTVSRDTLILMAVIAGFYHSVFRSLLTASIENTAHKISTGKFDQLLLLPVNIHFITLSNRYHFPRFVRLLVSFLFIFIISQYYQIHLSLTAFPLLIFVLACICYLAIGASIYFISLCIILQNPDVSNSIEVANNVVALSKLPPSILDKSNFLLKIFLFPLLLLAFLPAMTFQGHVILVPLLQMLAGTLVLTIMSYQIFNLCIKQYVGSN